MESNPNVDIAPYSMILALQREVRLLSFTIDILRERGILTERDMTRAILRSQLREAERLAASANPTLEPLKEELSQKVETYKSKLQALDTPA